MIVDIDPFPHGTIGPQALEFAHLIGDVKAEAGEIGRKTLGDAPQYLGNPLIADGGGYQSISRADTPTASTRGKWKSKCSGPSCK